MRRHRGPLILRLPRELAGLSRDASGITLIEVLIASLIVGIGAIGLALMFAHGQAFIAGEGDNRVAVYLAQQKIEEVRAQRVFQGFDILTTPTPPDESFSQALETV